MYHQMQNKTTKTSVISVNEYEHDDDDYECSVKTGLKKMDPAVNIVSINNFFQQITETTADFITDKMSDFDESLYQGTENIVNLIGNEQFTAKILNSWQIRVRIIKLKYLLGIKENTSIYVKVKIGEQEFFTQIKQVNDLTFAEVQTKKHLNRL